MSTTNSCHSNFTFRNLSIFHSSYYVQLLPYNMLDYKLFFFHFWPTFRFQFLFLLMACYKRMQKAKIISLYIDLKICNIQWHYHEHVEFLLYSISVFPLATKKGFHQHMLFHALYYNILQLNSVKYLSQLNLFDKSSSTLRRDTCTLFILIRVSNNPY